MARSVTIDGRELRLSDLSPMARAALVRIAQMDEGIAQIGRRREAMAMAWNMHVEALQAEVLRGRTGVEFVDPLDDD